MQKKRPVNLNLFTIRFPVTAIASILHRASGVLLFIFILFMLYALSGSLQSADTFAKLQTCLSTPEMRFLSWVFLSSLVFHIFAGIRHLLMDLGYAEEKASGAYGAYLVIIFSIIVIFALGIRLW